MSTPREVFDNLFRFMDENPEAVDRAWEAANAIPFTGPTGEDLMRWQLNDWIDSAVFDIHAVGGIMPNTRDSLFRAIVMAHGIIPINFRRASDRSGTPQATEGSAEYSVERGPSSDAPQ